MTEFELLALFEYQVGTCWTEENKLRLKESAISSEMSLWDE